MQRKSFQNLGTKKRGRRSPEMNIYCAITNCQAVVAILNVIVLEEHVSSPSGESLK
jgi:hypothetical protein